MKRLKFLIIIFSCLYVNLTFAQVGYQKDSLQIKVYTEAEYRNGLVKEVEVKNVFCDYCTEYQKRRIVDEAIKRTYLARYEEGIKLSNGKYRHAIYIRISKKDFLEIKLDSINNNH